MRPSTRSICLSLLLLFVACGVRQTAEELWSSSRREAQARRYHKAVKVLEKLVSAYPEHALAPRAQFQIGDIYLKYMDDLQSSIAAYQETTARYPETGEAANALFMVGFVYANHIGEYVAARDAYVDFLNRYPNHELVPSVIFELENLGKLPDEIDAIKGAINAS